MLPRLCYFVYKENSWVSCIDHFMAKLALTVRVLILTLLIKNIIDKYPTVGFEIISIPPHILNSNFYSVLKKNKSPILQTKFSLKNIYLIVIVISCHPHIFKLFGIKVQCVWHNTLLVLSFCPIVLFGICSDFLNLFWSCTDKLLPWIPVYKAQYDSSLLIQRV